MRSPCGPPKFDEHDWSQFDFSRWHVGGVAPDATSAAVAELAERLFSSEEWRERFQGTLPGLRRELIGFHREHARRLEEEKAATTRAFEERVAAARRRSDEFGRAVEAAAAPPLVEPAAHTFQVAVKVMVEKGRVGLPGIVARMTDPGHPEVVLAETITDPEGNAVLVIPKDKAGERDKTDAVFEVLDPTGKPLQKRPEVVCIRVGQVETKLIAVRDTPELQAQKNAALDLRAHREARARTLAAKPELLKQEQERRMRDFDCRLEEARKMADALEQAATSPSEPPTPAAGPTVKPQAGPSKRERPATPPKRPRKS